MSSVNITIGQKAPILESRKRGPKTIFIKARDTWSGSGTTEPSVPLDIIISVEATVGAVVVTDNFSLPNVGYTGVFAGDRLVVYAEYSDRQGLGTPFPRYLIEAGYSMDVINRNASSECWKWPPSHSIQYWPSATGWGAIPSFSKEFRLQSNMLGTLLLSEFNVAAGTIWLKRFDWEELEQWTPLNPLAAKWRAIVEYSTFASTWANERGSATLEFR